MKKGDAVGMLVPIAGSGGLQYWIEAEVVAANSRYIIASDGEKEWQFDARSKEQTSGGHKRRGPRRIEEMSDVMTATIAESALKKSEYDRRERTMEYLRGVDLYALQVETVERIAELVARDESE